MINNIVKWLTGRDIILYNPHRNSEPLVNDHNKKRFIFINPIVLLKATFILGRDTKLRYRTMGLILDIIDPAYILDINWIGKLHSLYYAWCSKNGKKFIVVQHGTYYAGQIIEIDHRYTKCHIFLVWSTYFKQLFESYNKGKNVEIIVIGNPVYNDYDRSAYEYKNEPGDKILVAVSLIEGERFRKVNRFLKKIIGLGFDVSVKEHSYQSREFRSFDWGKRVGQGGESLYEMLKNQIFDIVMTDISTAMNDIIFFKNRALLFSPTGNSEHYTKNIYSRYLKNAAQYEGEINKKEDLYRFLDVEAQENLLEYLIETEDKDNRLDFLP